MADTQQSAPQSTPQSAQQSATKKVGPILAKYFAIIGGLVGLTFGCLFIVTDCYVLSVPYFVQSEWVYVFLAAILCLILKLLASFTDSVLKKKNIKTFQNF